MGMVLIEREEEQPSNKRTMRDSVGVTVSSWTMSDKHTIYRAPKSPFLAGSNAADCARLIGLFPGLAACSEAHFLALRPYLRGCPERFFNRHAYSLMLDWLNSKDGDQREALQEYLANFDVELSAAFLFLRQINSEDWHDKSISDGDSYDNVRLVDKVLHPAYLRLSEGVLASLIRPAAHFARLDRGKLAEGMDVFNLVDELGKSSMAECVRPYRHTMRNGIGHGGVTYLHDDIRYRDKKGNEETLSVRSVIRVFDDMVDTCNALAAALKVFLVTKKDHGYRFPRELIVEELLEETRTSWWEIEGCVESEVLGGKQLLIYARPSSRDALKVQWSAIQSAVLAEFLAPGYSRYFFSFRSPKALPGWAGFDGGRLAQLRARGATEVHEYVSALEDTGFFYFPRVALPRALRKLDTFFKVFSSHFKLVREQVRESLRMAQIACRNATIHRNAWGCVVRGSVVITEFNDEVAAHIIRSNKRRILRVVTAAARSSTSKFELARYLPIGYARINVFSEDFRRRRLDGFGLGPQLICTIQLQRIRRIRSPDIVGSTVEAEGDWRIAWNRAWIAQRGCL